MSVGNQPTVSGLNAELGALAVNLRNQLQQVQNLFEYLVAIGGATGLETIGFDTADANLYFNTMSYLSTVAQVFYGTATQASEFDFDNAICQAYGGS